MDKFQFDTVLCAMADKVENLQDKIVFQQSALDRAHEQMADLEDKVRDQEEAIDGLQRLPPIEHLHQPQTGATMIDTAHVLWTMGQRDKLVENIRELLSCFSNDSKAQSQRIKMIKHVRLMTGLGLKEAKELVDEIIPYKPGY